MKYNIQNTAFIFSTKLPRLSVTSVLRIKKLQTLYSVHKHLLIIIHSRNIRLQQANANHHHHKWYISK